MICFILKYEINNNKKKKKKSNIKWEDLYYFYFEIWIELPNINFKVKI